jgi:hypothetical protein
MAIAMPVKERMKLIYEAFCKGVVDLIKREGRNLDFHQINRHVFGSSDCTHEFAGT